MKNASDIVVYTRNQSKRAPLLQQGKRREKSQGVEELVVADTNTTVTDSQNSNTMPSSANQVPKEEGSANQKATKTTKRACTECRKVKGRCDITRNQSKCDRCIRLKRECVPHVSRQGKRREKSQGVEEHVVADTVTASGFQLQASAAGNGTVMSAGPAISNTCANQVSENVGFSQFQQQQHHQQQQQWSQPTFASITVPAPINVQQGDFVAPTNNLNNNSFISQQGQVHQDPCTFSQLGMGVAECSFANQNQAYPPTQYNNRCGSQVAGPDDPNLSMESTRAVFASAYTGHDQYIPSFNGSAMPTYTSSANTLNQSGCSPVVDAQNNCPSNIQETMQNDTTSEPIPLRQWITSALKLDVTSKSNHGISALSPDYIVACLKIATSLSKQVSEMEEKFPNDKLHLLSPDIFTWAEYVTVKLNENEPCLTGDYTPHSSIADRELDGLESLFGSIRANDECDEARFLNVDSAELLSSITNLNVLNNDLLSSYAKQKRIFALGLVFYELFSGGRMRPSEALPLAYSANQGLTAEGSYVSATLKLKDEGKDDCHTNWNDIIQGNKPSKRQVSFASHVDLLKPLGLSYNLCGLIQNMLDSSSDFSQNTSYKQMSDVITDLHLMIEKPSIYLHDFDLTHLSTTGLQLDTFHMRDEEFASLESAYQRSTKGSYELVLISGEAGTGKSFMVERLGRDITSSGRHFVSVKFGQLKSANPLCTLTSAFSHYCTLLIEENDNDFIQSMASELQNALVQQDVYHLAKMIPKLSDILDIDISSATYSDQDCVNGQEKIHYLLTTFVEVISSCSKGTVTLWLDDCQWADLFSLTVLEQILMLPRESNPFFIICCYRSDEVDESHPFKNMCDRLSGFFVELTMIQLDCMNKSTVNKMISELLCLPPRLVTGLTDVLYSKTKGNALFLSRLVESLNRDGLINLSLTKHRWVWDEERIQSIELPADVASFFSRNIQMLSPEIQSVLQVLACFGVLEKKEVSILESNLGMDLSQPLKSAIDEGFVCIKNAAYCFSHDKFMEAVYCMVPLGERRCQHLKYARCFAKEALVNKGDCFLFAAVSQFHLAGSATVTDPVESAEIAKLNLTSGLRAIARSNHYLAAEYCKSGRSFLNKNHWQTHYSLCIELLKLAAQAALALQDFDLLSVLGQQVDEHALSFDDKVDVKIAVMTAMAYAKQIPQAISLGLSILSKLNHELSATWTEDDILYRSREAQRAITSITHEDLMNHKKMTEPRHRAAMKCLAQMQLTTFLVNPNLQPEVTLKMVNMTLSFGLCQQSAVAFAYYASLLLKLGEMGDAHRFAKLAKALLAQDGSNEITGDVVFITSEVLGYFEPLLSVNEYRSQGIDVAKSAGDVHFACMLKLMYSSAMYCSGVDLPTVKDEFLQAISYTKRHCHMTSCFYLVITLQSIRALLGEPGETETTKDELTNPHQLIVFNFMKIAQFMLLNINHDAREYVDKFFQYRMPNYLCISSDANHAYYVGLMSFRIYRNSNEMKWLDRAKQCKTLIELWAKEGSEWNFGQKLALLQAEELYSTGNFESAYVSYDKAISLARSHKFLIDEALSNELAGYCHLSAGNNAAMNYFVSAHRNYIDWGANAKATSLFHFVQGAFSIPTMLVNNE